MTTYHGHSLTSVDGEIVLLKFIESLSVRNESDELIDKLKGDVVISVRTISGKEHDFSMCMIIESTPIHSKDSPDNLATAIIEKWHWLNKP